MISQLEPELSWFLWILGAMFLFGAGIPLLLSPKRWARAFKWTVPDDLDAFTVYLGRCLGGVSLALVVFVFRAAPEPENHRWLVELLLLIAVIFAAIHTLGALQRRQPWTETLEIAMYIGIFAVGLWLLIEV